MASRPSRLATTRRGDVFRQSRDLPQDAQPTRRHRIVEGIHVARIAEHHRQLLRLEQLLVRQRPQPLEGLLDGAVAVPRVVVEDDRVLLARHVGRQLLEPDADQAPLRAELDVVPLDLRGHARGQLRALEHDEDVVQHDGVLELERGQPRQHLLEPLPIRLDGRDRLVRLREDVGDRVELVALLAHEERHRLALLRDGDDERAGLLGDALGGAVPRPGLGGRDRRIGHELDVRVREPLQLGVEDDRAVHLRELVQELRAEVEVEPHPAGEHELELGGLADDDQRTAARADDVVDSLAQFGAGRDPGDGGEQLGVAARILLARTPVHARGRARRLLFLMSALGLQPTRAGSLGGASPPPSCEVCHEGSSRPRRRPRPRPSFPHSSSRRSPCVAGRRRPVRPISAKAASESRTAAPLAADAIASATGRSAPGSSIRTPPATLTNTSAEPSATPACRESTATIIASRLGSTPVPTRRGMARSVGETSAWISSRIGRVPSSAHATAAPGSPVCVRPNSSDGLGTP